MNHTKKGGGVFPQLLKEKQPSTTQVDNITGTSRPLRLGNHRLHKKSVLLCTSNLIKKLTVFSRK